MKITIEQDSMIITLESESVDDLVEFMSKNIERIKNNGATLDTSVAVEELGLPVRISNSLRNHGITELSQLISLKYNEPVKGHERSYDYDEDMGTGKWTEEPIIIENLDNLYKLRGFGKKTIKYIKEKLSELQV